MAPALVNPPSVHWTDGLSKRVAQFRKGVDDILLSPLTTNKEPPPPRPEH